MRFELLIQPYGLPPDIWATQMVSTFRDQAFRWFSSLQIDSISSYEQLMEKFLAHFNNSRAKKEVLRDYEDGKTKER
jgi:hypothetical protein